mgnify:FL=1
MAISAVSIAANVQLPAIGGGFVYDIVAECTVGADVSTSLGPILVKAGLLATANVVGLSGCGDVPFANAGAGLVPISTGSELQYRLVTDGVANSTAMAPTAGVQFRLLVIG